MSVRPPQALDRLSSLSSSLGDSPSERRSPGHTRQPSDASESTGLVQRCVVIQRDQHGFGFTVSGDRVVLVQSVRPGGAAMKAGVQEGDRIVKVNGTMVTNSSHLEVVKLIKSGAYVALTLLGSPPGISGSQQDPEPSGCPQGTPPAPPPPQRITEPRPLQDPEVQKHAAQILRNMLRQEEAELQRFQELLSRNPGAAVEEQLEGARRRVSQLQLKILQESQGSADSGFRPLEGEVFRSLPAFPGSGRAGSGSGSGSGSPQLPGRFSMDSQDGDSGLESGPERLPSLGEVSLARNSGLSEPESPRTSPVLGSRLSQLRRQGSDLPFPTDQGLASGKPLIIGPEEDCEPGYSNNESDSLFQDLKRLKSRPAHLGVFLRFLFSQADPTPLLFYLCCDVCRQQSNPKDSRAFGRDIWNIFLDRNAPLRVKVPEQLLTDIDNCLRNGGDLQHSLEGAQESVLPEIQGQLREYRTKRTLGLGSLYGENELQELEGNSQREQREQRERAVAERQLGHLGDILSKYEEERSSALAFALGAFLAHAGIRSREPRPPGAPEKLPDKDKWLPFFPKAKKSSSSKKEKDSLESDKRRNPILRYIGKPRISSQSTFHVPLSPVEALRPGNVRTMIQHFESGHGDGAEPGAPRESPDSGGGGSEGPREADGSRSEVRLGRSESLKGREELKKSRKSELVPRSRSDVDMDAAAEASRLHQSASSSASSLSARSVENPTPPYTPKMGRRSVDSPSLGFGADPFLPHLLEDEQGPIPDLEPDPECQAWSSNSQAWSSNSQGWQQHSQGSQSWQHSVARELVASLPQREVDRQEVINELFGTEGSHLRILRVLDLLFYQRLRRENLLSREELGLLFPNLPDLIDVHNSLSESMKKLREEGPIIREIGDLMLARFDGAAKEEFQRVAATFCSYQSIALELIKTKQRKESRFQLFMQEAESNPQCRRLQLKDLIVSEMQRLTKYPLLLENIIKCTEAGSPEQEKLCRARDQCRDVLRFVNDAVRRAENRHRLQGYQRRLDTAALERTSNPLAAEFRNLDLTSHRMIHEGPLTWRVAKDKTVELHVLLLEELLVLLQRQDERLVLKCHSKSALGASSDTKGSFSPVLKLNSVLIRSVATDKRALFIICTSELGPQIYELVALTSSEKNTWMELLEQAVQGATRSVTGPPKQHHSEATTAATGLELPDPDVSPVLSRGSGAEPEAEDCSSADSDPDPSGRDKPLEELLEEPGGQEGDLGQAGIGVTDPIPGVPKYLGGAGVAEAALQDVETLQLLIVRWLRPGRDPDPEDDVTPTPSVAGAASGQGWDSVVSGRDSVMSSWDSAMSSRDLPLSGRDLSVSSQDPVTSGRDSPMSSQDLVMSSRDLPVSGRDLPMSGQDLPVSSWDLPVSSWDLPMSGRDLPMSSRDLPMSGRDLPMSGQDLPMSSRDLPVSSWDLPVSGRDSALSSQDSVMSGRDLPMSGRDLPMSSRDSAAQDGSREEPEGPEPNGIQIVRKGLGVSFLRFGVSVPVPLWDWVLLPGFGVSFPDLGSPSPLPA
ncbi:rho guanine nucleotide exchange factor 11-like isoform X2 [Aphelocoma coerulescens]|uniref:rho guanine nucleotide exchange factor 11-like isoform X2 n=1 Tax=Aphelocoma coerulescens TaxID=39617 RepID=UPI00360518C5